MKILSVYEWIDKFASLPATHGMLEFDDAMKEYERYKAKALQEQEIKRRKPKKRNRNR